MTASTAAPLHVDATPQHGADTAAAAADRAAELATRAAQPANIAQASSPSSPLAQGPALATEQLRARMLTLIGNLKTARDTEPSQLAQVLGVVLGPDPEDAKSQLAVGPLTDGGRYSVTVDALHPGTPGRHVAIHWTPPGWKGDPRKPENALATCSLEFAPLNNDIAALGYSRSKSAPHLKESWSFRKDMPSNNIAFYLVVNLYRAIDSADPKGRPCVLSVEIDADHAESSHG
ncbi:hypothetical protein K4L06_01310 [Lysobacter sp. BMK333-48F3]|uniref:hypothetical protein n=1 Tax=Lysobacter sp. BMK333-48F3 TaxID=2867962 RepID=UPI001C8C84C1|nr:hypothetical protein [Lysobacter sp. BMK333-48F3]MBX9399933.1 hypothetical protein [Lysobacter sp. BMK333-48F3]